MAEASIPSQQAEETRVRSPSSFSLPRPTVDPITGPVPAVRSPVCIGGRLQLFADRWQTLLPESSVPAQLRKGVRWKFRQQPSLTDTPVSFPCSQATLTGLRAAAKALLDKGATELLPRQPATAGFYSRLFLVPKPSGESRPIIDLSILNSFIQCEHFKMETPASIRESLQEGEWTFQLDIKDAFLHIPVHPAYRKYLRFTVGNDVYQFKTLPFGLSVSPRTFTYVLKPVVALLRERGIKVHAYLDDWLGRSLARSLARSHGREAAELLTYLGWVINWEKSDLSGTQSPVFIGLHFLLQWGKILPGPDALPTS